MQQRTISWDRDTITLSGGLALADIRDFSNALNVVGVRKGYKDIALNFGEAFPVREVFMVPAIAVIRDYRRRGFSFDLRLPENMAARSIFHNANWAFLIDDVSNSPSTFDGDGHLPASSYTSLPEQTAAVDRVMSMILKIAPLQRKQLVALEWSVNEITDNVLNHSQSAMGGVIQASTISTGGRQMVEFVVADAGIGIKRSLGETKDVRALERAIQEGVTRNRATNQGNGLYGTFRVSTLSRGRFELHSYHASLIADGASGDVRTNRADNFYPGTVVACRVGCDDEKLIENALMFKGKVHEPGFDYIEKHYDSGVDRSFEFKMNEECASFGSREAGIGTRVLIENLLRADPTYPLVVDFEGVAIISSSFADEVFGRLFAALGPMAFMSRVSFKNVDSSLRAVLDRAISQRMSQSIG